MNRIEQVVFDLVRKYFPDPGISMLELCPGQGDLSRQLLNAHYKNLEALDINPENFKVAEIKCHPGNLADDLPFEDNTYDLVLAVEGIEHLEDQYHFIKECTRILKPKGTLIVTTPNIISFGSRIKFLFTGFYSLCTRPLSEFKKDWVNEHIAPLTFWQLRHILHTHGMLIKKITTDHIRKSSLVGLLFYPLSYFITYLNVTNRSNEIEPRQLKVNKDINRQMHNPSLFFGRTMIVVAKKEEYDYIK
ncbi:MAG: methyltransferase domain-containing protein [Nitrospinaceae bacterium]|nr:methyltransferase domain-containing protein [Nitrospinaceae bacterium]